MKYVIVEDEPAAAKRLAKMIHLSFPEAEVVAVLDSVEIASDWFHQRNDYDLVFMDIQLSDGLSFEIFDRINIRKPVIFTTAFDQYAIQAFKVNSIDYLLKPVKMEELDNAIRKYQNTRNPAAEMQEQLESLKQMLGGKKSPRRILIRAGNTLKALNPDDASYFYMEEKSVIMKLSDGHGYPVDQSLDQIEEIVDPSKFFRINRQYIVNFNSLAKMKAHSKGRLKIELDPPSREEVIVSTNRSPEFKQWLEGSVSDS